MSITINYVNHAPTGANNTVTTAGNTPYTFTKADFGFSDPNDTPPNNLLAVKITTRPNAGTLSDNGVAVTAGQFVSVADINSGKLVFIPAANANGAGYASFTFQVQDDGGTANGGTNLDPSPKTMTINVAPVILPIPVPPSPPVVNPSVPDLEPVTPSYPSAPSIPAASLSSASAMGTSHKQAAVTSQSMRDMKVFADVSPAQSLVQAWSTEIFPPGTVVSKIHAHESPKPGKLPNAGTANGQLCQPGEPALGRPRLATKAVEVGNLRPAPARRLRADAHHEPHRGLRALDDPRRLVGLESCWPRCLPGAWSIR